jgi:hypothetical protein
LKKLVSFIVCSNGYGHLKRVISVVNQLNLMDKNICSIIFINITHINFLNKDSHFVINDKKRVIFNTELSEFEPLWNNRLSLDFYKKWNRQLSKNELLKKSDLIVSDNHLSPLACFNNVILMGSFLWIDIENESNHIDKIVNYENNLLIEKKPVVICQKDLVMKSIIDKAKPIKLPWFCSGSNKIDFKLKNDILITGGGTKNNNQSLIELIKSIHKKNKSFKFFVDKNLYKSFEKENFKIVNEFDYTENSFLKLKYVICRPGMGILTECIKYNIVPITLDFNDNNEMKNNSRIISNLKLGRFFNLSNKSDFNSNEIIRFLEDSKSYKLFLKNIKNQLKGGHIEAAKTIISAI